MTKVAIVNPRNLISDFVILLLVAAGIYALGAFGVEWDSSYNPNYQISLSFSALPIYAVFSALRGLFAYLVSLGFTLVIGFWAAKSPRAEKIILPFLDIMQSIPVLGFLPGLVLGLVALFPRTNVGLELAAILMIFTGQVWNMTFAFYSSLKSVPTDMQEATAMMGLSARKKFTLLELPYAAMNLTWNSLMSMAGGWFFLTVCESFTLGDAQYRLPGLGAYMSTAMEAGDSQAILAGIFAMCLIIFLFDFLLWRPALIWAHKFRLEDKDGEKPEEPLIQLLLKDSWMVNFIKTVYFRSSFTAPHFRLSEKFLNSKKTEVAKKFISTHVNRKWLIEGLGAISLIVALLATYRLVDKLSVLGLSDWLGVLTNTGFTFIRVIAAVILGTLWATPAGIWIAQSPQRLRVAQPIIQMMASFPAPMLYPLAISVFLYLNIHFEVSAMLLMLLGVQWYILFNVLAGALKIPNELRLAMQLMNSSRWHQWRFLYLPSVLPSLVTGWLTAAGGAWNASIVSEMISYRGQTFIAHGLGADISQAAAHGDFARLSACLLVMVVLIVILNRTFWAKIYQVTQTRYRLDL